VSDLQAKPLIVLDELGRVRAAMVAAGRAEHAADSLPAVHRQALAELVSVDGKATAGITSKVIAILRQAGREIKAEGIEEIQ